MCAKSLQSCPTLCDPTDCSLPGSCVHGIFWASILEWVAISFSRGSSPSRDWTQVSCISYILRYPPLPLVPPGKPIILEHFLLFLIPCSLFENTLFRKIIIYFWLHWVFIAACRFLTVMASLVAEHGFSSCHIQAYLLCGLWNLPGPGIEPVSPAPGARRL